MNERQLRIADEWLHILKQRDGRASKSTAEYILFIKFTEIEDGIDIEYTYKLLSDEYHLIEPLGQAWIMLTPEGEKYAKKGLNYYRMESSIKEKLESAGKLIAAISSLTALIGFLIGLLF